MSLVCYTFLFLRMRVRFLICLIFFSFIRIFLWTASSWLTSYWLEPTKISDLHIRLISPGTSRNYWLNSASRNSKTTSPLRKTQQHANWDATINNRLIHLRVMFWQSALRAATNCWKTSISSSTTSTIFHKGNLQNVQAVATTWRIWRIGNCVCGTATTVWTNGMSSIGMGRSNRS